MPENGCRMRYCWGGTVAQRAVEGSWTMLLEIVGHRPMSGHPPTAAYCPDVWPSSAVAGAASAPYGRIGVRSIG